MWTVKRLVLTCSVNSPVLFLNLGNTSKAFNNIAQGKVPASVTSGTATLGSKRD
ncbi:hypothetical protein Pla52n_64330 [Stieleria varia]|uniref:Uncharacterized protein n=1 Tax=Stieleria varia TaxID=2528005 RepID=A0A5C5ZXS7_9BACT|nr:hypothetical protein Pla52n_64330 [Stieleria varia]